VSLGAAAAGDTLVVWRLDRPRPVDGASDRDRDRARGSGGSGSTPSGPGHARQAGRLLFGIFRSAVRVGHLDPD